MQVSERGLPLVAALLCAACGPGSGGKDAGGVLCGEPNTNATYFVPAGVVYAVGAGAWDSAGIQSLVVTASGAPDWVQVGYLKLTLEARGTSCATKVSLFLHAPAVGAFGYRLSSADKKPTFWGMYQEHGGYDDTVTDQSTLELTAQTEAAASGRFTLTLKDGRAVTGHFMNVPLSGARRYNP